MKKVPMLRFPGFSGEWEEKRLGDFAKFSKGKGISKSDISEDGKYECIRYGELYTEYGEVIAEIKSRTNLDLKTLVLSDANDVIIPASGETQLDIAKASCVVKSGIALGGDLNIIKTEHNGAFISFYLNNKRKIEIASLAQGNSVVHLYSKQLAQLTVNLPALPEQQKIADFLSAVDARLQALKKKKGLLEQYKKGVMQQIFAQEIRFKGDDGRAFADWEEKKLGEIGNFKNGLNKGKEDFGFGHPFINLMDVFGKSYIVKGAFGLVNASQKELLDYDLKLGDVLFIRSSVKLDGIGETVVILEDITNVVYSGFLIRFREKINILDNNFKKYCFKTEQFRNQILSVSTTSANTNINQESLNLLSISIPSLPEQQKIADFLTSLDEKISRCSAQIAGTELWKKGLLQGLFV